MREFRYTVGWVWPILSLLLCSQAVFDAAPIAAGLSPILVGVSNAQTGPFGSLGRQLLEGSMAYLDRVNKLGGIHGRPVKLIVEDDQYEPELAVQNTNRLITHDRVFFLFDYMGTPTLTRLLPLLKYYSTEQVVNVAPLSGALPQRTPPYEQFVFNIRASYDEEAKALVRYLYSRGARKIGFLGQADAFGKSGESAVTKALAEYDLQIVSSVTYLRNQSADQSMHEQAGILKESGADGVIVFGLFGPCAAFIRDARLAGWNIPIASVSNVSAYALIAELARYQNEEHPDLTANLVTSQVVPSLDQVDLPLVGDFVRNGPRPIHRFITFEGWLNAAVVTEALKRTGPDPTRAKFIDAMESLGNWDPGIGVNLQFSKTSHQGMHTVWLTVSRNGRWESVDQP